MRIGHAAAQHQAMGTLSFFSPFPSSVNFVKIVIKRGIYVVPHKLYSAAGALPDVTPSQTCIRFLLSFGGILFVQYMCCTWRSLMKFLVMAGPLSEWLPAKNTISIFPLLVNPSPFSRMGHVSAQRIAFTYIDVLSAQKRKDHLFVMICMRTVRTIPLHAC